MKKKEQIEVVPKNTRLKNLTLWKKRKNFEGKIRTIGWECAQKVNEGKLLSLDKRREDLDHEETGEGKRKKGWRQGRERYQEKWMRLTT